MRSNGRALVTRPKRSPAMPAALARCPSCARWSIASMACAPTLRRTSRTKHSKLITSSDRQEIAPEGAKTFVPITTTTNLQFNKLNTVEGAASKNRQPGNGSSSTETPRIKGKRSNSLDPVEETITKYRIAPKMIAKLGGQWWTELVPKGREIDWNDIQTIGATTRKFVGISDHAWDEGLRVCGPIILATLVAVIYAKSRPGAKKPIRSKGGYFRGMVAKAAAGELNLPPSLYALNDEISEEERQQRG